MFGGQVLPGGYVWAGAAIEPTLIRARFDKPGSEPLVLLLKHPSTAGPGQTITAKFTLSFSGRGNDEFLRVAADHIRASENDFVWTLLENNPQTITGAATDTSAARHLSMALGVGALILIVALWAQRFYVRPRQPGSEDSTPHARRALRVIAMGAGVLVAARIILELRHFLLDYDDFDYLLRAAVNPWRPDESIRFLSTTVLYRVAMYFGSRPAVYMGMSTLAFVAMLYAYRGFLQRLGFSKYSTVLAVAFWGLSPAPMYLLSWAAGFQQLLGMALVLSGLSAGLAATRTNDKNALISALAKSITFVTIGVFVKFPLIFLVAPSLFLCSLLVHFPRPSARRIVGCTAAVALVPASLLALAHQTMNRGDGEKFGLSRIANNIHDVGQGLSSSVSPLRVAAIVIFIAHVALAWRDGFEKIDFRGLFSKIVTLRVGGASLFVFTFLLSVSWIAPFLLNARYFAGYYVSLAAAVFAACAARICEVLLPARHPTLITLLALLAAFPLTAFQRDEHQQRRENIAKYLQVVVKGLHDQPRVDEIALLADCQGNGNAEEQMNRDILFFLNRMSGEAGIRWATGRYDVSVKTAQDLQYGPFEPSRIEVRVCQDRLVRVDLRK